MQAETAVRLNIHEIFQAFPPGNDFLTMRLPAEAQPAGDQQPRPPLVNPSQLGLRCSFLPLSEPFVIGSVKISGGAFFLQPQGSYRGDPRCDGMQCNAGPMRISTSAGATELRASLGPHYFCRSRTAAS